MPLLILFLFIAIPLLEIGVFIQVGGLIGLWPTIGTVILTAVIGVTLLRIQGLATLARAQASLNRGEAPLREVFDGACLVAAGALLLTPGFVTDTIGFLLLMPPVRTFLRRRVANIVRNQGRPGPGFPGGESWPEQRHGRDPGVIDVEFQEVNDNSKDENKDQP